LAVGIVNFTEGQKVAGGIRARELDGKDIARLGRDGIVIGLDGALNGGVQYRATIEGAIAAAAGEPDTGERELGGVVLLIESDDGQRSVRSRANVDSQTVSARLLDGCSGAVERFGNLSIGSVDQECQVSGRRLLGRRSARDASGRKRPRLRQAKG